MLLPRFFPVAAACPVVVSTRRKPKRNWNLEYKKPPRSRVALNFILRLASISALKFEAIKRTKKSKVGAT